MMEFLYNLIIQPIYMLLELIFNDIYHSVNNILLTLFLVSFIISLLCLPLYLRAEKLEKEENEIKKRLKDKINAIKRNYKGDERFLLLKTYYKQNNYSPIMALRSSLGLLLQIPIFIGAYQFFSHLTLFIGMECFLISDLSKPDGLLKIGNLSINILPILMTIVNLLAGIVYVKNASVKENKTIFIMSLFFLILLYNSPSSLVLYWLFNNLFSLLKNVCLKFSFDFGYKRIDKIIGWFCNFLPRINYTKMFIISILTYWVIIGLFVPSSVVSSSIVEFMFQDSKPCDVILYATNVFAGAILFWGSVIYYFANEKYRKIISCLTVFLPIISLFNYYMLQMPYAILLNTFVYEAGILTFETCSPVYKIMCYAALFLICLLALRSLYLKKRILEKLFICILVVCFFTSVLYCLIVYGETKIINRKNKILSQKKDAYIKLSKTNKNVVVIFLDRAIGSYIPIIFSEHPQIIKQFRGFNYYINSLSYAGYTLMGYMPILGGYEYIPMRIDEIKGRFEKKFNESIVVLPAIFKQNNWNSTVINPVGEGWQKETWSGVTDEEIKIFENNELYEKYGISSYAIPDDISKTLNKDDEIMGAELSKRNLIYYSLLYLSSFKMRNYLYQGGLYHNPTENPKDYYTPSFIKSYAEMSALSKITDFSSNKNNFIVFNNDLTHYPANLKYPNYDIASKNDEDYIPPVPKDLNDWTIRHYCVNVASIKLLGEYFDYLRKNGAWDNTRIIIVSDHGFTHGLKHPEFTPFLEKHYLPYNALLMVKDFNSNKEFKISYELMTNADVPLIATKSIIKEPKNPFTGRKLSNKDKNNGVLIKADSDWEPRKYLGKRKVISENQNFYYVKDNAYDSSNWKINIGYKEALKIFNKK